MAQDKKSSRFISFLSIVLILFSVYSMIGFVLGISYDDSVGNAWVRFLGEGGLTPYTDGQSWLGVPVQMASWIFTLMIGVIALFYGVMLLVRPEVGRIAFNGLILLYKKILGQ